MYIWIVLIATQVHVYFSAVFFVHGMHLDTFIFFSTDLIVYLLFGLAENHDGRSCLVVEPAEAHEGENPLKMSQHLEHVPEMSVSPEQKQAKVGKVNLRKSLAWDSAFFTSEGANP